MASFEWMYFKEYKKSKQICCRASSSVSPGCKGICFLPSRMSLKEDGKNYENAFLFCFTGLKHLVLVQNLKEKKCQQQRALRPVLKR
jgi:hypothetical protein